MLLPKGERGTFRFLEGVVGAVLNENALPT
jgi:hypothetical protein